MKDIIIDTLDNLFSTNIKKNKETIVNLKKLVKELTKDLHTLKVENSSLKKNLDDITNKNKSIEESLVLQKNENCLLKQKLERSENAKSRYILKINDFKEKLKEAQYKIQSFIDEKNLIQSELDYSKDIEVNLSKKVSNLENLLSGCQSELNERKNSETDLSVKVSNLENLLTKYTTELTKKNEDYLDAKNENNKLKSEMQIVVDKYNKEQEISIGLKNMTLELQSQIEKDHSIIKELNDIICQEKRTIEQSLNQIEIQTKELSEKERIISDKNVKIEELNNELEKEKIENALLSNELVDLKNEYVNLDRNDNLSEKKELTDVEEENNLTNNIIIGHFENVQETNDEIIEKSENIISESNLECTNIDCTNYTESETTICENVYSNDNNIKDATKTDIPVENNEEQNFNYPTSKEDNQSEITFEKNIIQVPIIIEESDYSKQHKVKRTIVDLIDVETGELVNADELLTDEQNNDKAVFSKMREALVLAQKSGIHKYICAVCNQPVRLNSRQYQGCDHVSNFFSHFSYSDECPAKTLSNGNIVAQTNTLLSRFKQSIVYESMFKTLSDLLTKSIDVSSLEIRNNKNGLHDSIIPEFRLLYKNKTKIGIDFQLYTTFVSKILEKSFRARKQKECSMWFFPYFSPTQQEMCAKDIYYGNRRNVFVFDSKDYYTNNITNLNSFKSIVPLYADYKYAQDESKKTNRLMLNCFWQIPLVEEGKLKIAWQHKLVSFEELTFDEDTGDIYYYDSDKDFNNTMNSQLYELLLNWKEEIKIRWNELEKVIAKRPDKCSSYSIETKEQKKMKSIMSLLKDGKNITSFYDEESDKYGYKIEDEQIIKPQYVEACDFDSNNIAIIKQTSNGKYGAINILGKKVINIQFTEIQHLVNDLYVCRKDKTCGLFSINKGEILKTNYLDITKLTDERLLVHEGYYDYERYYLGTNSYGTPRYGGNWNQHDYGYKIYDLEGNAISKSYNKINYLFDDYIYAEEDNKKLLLDIDGNILSKEFNININGYGFQINAIENGLVFISNNYSFYNRVAIFSFSGETIYTSSEFDKILPFNDIAYEVFNEKGRALISKEDGRLLVSERHTFDNDFFKEWTLGWTLYDNCGTKITDNCSQILKTKQDLFIIEDFNEKYSLIDSKGAIIIEPKYSYIKFFTDDRILVKSQHYYSLPQKYGVININNETIIPIEFDTIYYENSLFKVTKGTVWGTYSYDGKILDDSLAPISDCHMKINQLGKWAITDKDNNLLTQYIYSDIQTINNNIYIVKNENGTGCLDLSLTTILECIYSNVEFLEDGNLKVKRQNRYGIYNSTGDCLIPINYEKIKMLSNGDYFVENGEEPTDDDYYNYNNYSFGIYGKNGNTIIEYGAYDSIKFVEDGYNVELDGMQGFIKTDGKLVPNEFEALNEHYSIGCFIYKVALCNKNEEAISDFIYNEIKLLSDNTFAVLRNDSKFNGWGILSEKGEELTECLYDEIIYTDNLFKVKLGNILYKLNKQYEVIPLVHSTVNYDIEQYKNHYTIKDKTGIVIHEADYEEFIISDAENFIVKKGNFGVIDTLGNFLIPNINKKITRINDTCFLCVKTKTKYVNNYWQRGYKTYDQEITIRLKDEQSLFAFEENKEYEGTIINIKKFGLFVEVKNIGTALLHISELVNVNKKTSQFSKGDNIKVRTKSVDHEKKRATLELILNENE